MSIGQTADAQVKVLNSIQLRRNARSCTDRNPAESAHTQVTIMFNLVLMQTQAKLQVCLFRSHCSCINTADSHVLAKFIVVVYLGYRERKCAILSQ